MAWWKKKAVTICEICGTRLPAGTSAILIEKDYFVGGARKTVRDVCEGCRRRHLPTADEARAQLRDGDTEVRIAAARELARHRHWKPAGDLRDALVREGWQTPVGREIVKALAALRGPEAENALIALLQDSEPAWHRPESHDMVHPSEADRLLADLLKMGGPTLVVQALCDLMISASELSIRAQAAKYLSFIAYSRTVVYGGNYEARLTDPARELMVEPLRATLRDESAWGRDDAAKALGRLGEASALQDLIDALGARNRYVRYSVAEALGNLGDKRAVPALRQAVDDPDIRFAVTEALKKLGCTIYP
jgi:HEAT repeat protein